MLRAEVAVMSIHAADDSHECVVALELAEVAERLGVPPYAGDRVQLEVIQDGLADDGPTRYEPWPPAWGRLNRHRRQTPR